MDSVASILAADGFPHTSAHAQTQLCVHSSMGVSWKPVPSLSSTLWMDESMACVQPKLCLHGSAMQSSSLGLGFQAHLSPGAFLTNPSFILH